MKPSSDRLWETLSSRELFTRPPWLRLYVDRVRLPNGRIIEDYHQVRLPDFAVVFAETGDGSIIAERHYKHGVGRVVVGLPAGMIEPGENPLTAARRELLEETGYKAQEWRFLGAFHGDANYGMGRAYLFSARRARKVAQPNSGDLEETEIVLLGLDEILDAVRTGMVGSLPNVSAIAMATHPLLAKGSRWAASPGKPRRKKS